MSKIWPATYSWVEHATRDTVEDPDIDSKSSSERRGDIEKTERQQGGVSIQRIIGVQSRLGANVGQQEEHECAAKFTDNHNNQIPRRVWEQMGAVPPSGIRVILSCEDRTKSWQCHDGQGGQYQGKDEVVLVWARREVLILDLRLPRGVLA